MYLAAVSYGCQFHSLSIEFMKDPLIQRAKAAIRKQFVACAGSPPIGMSLTAKLMKLALREGDWSSAQLYCVAYAFLLRVPSEGIPLKLGAVETGEAPTGKWLTRAGDNVMFYFDRRKNREAPTRQTRGCWCKCCTVTCPVHGLTLLDNPALLGSAPFEKCGPTKTTNALRRRLAKLGVADAPSFTLKGFRRGHARDIAMRGGRLAEILHAGSWTSKAFAAYLDKEQVLDKAVAEIQDSSSDDSETEEA